MVKANKQVINNIFQNISFENQLTDSDIVPIPFHCCLTSYPGFPPAN